MAGLAVLRAYLQPGDVMLFQSQQCVSDLIRAAEPDCPVNHAALVIKPEGLDDGDEPGVLNANWDYVLGDLQAGAICPLDLDQVLTTPAHHVTRVWVMRPQDVDPAPVIGAALGMYANRSAYRFDAGGLVTIGVGLLLRNPAQIVPMYFQIRRCLGPPTPPQPRPLVPPPQMVTCAAFVYLCFAEEGSNALGPVARKELAAPRAVRDRSGHEQTGSGQGRWKARLAYLKVLAPQAAATIPDLSNREDPLWVTPNWLWHCHQLSCVATWVPDWAESSASPAA